METTADTAHTTYMIDVFPSPDGFSVRILDTEGAEIKESRGQWSTESAARRWAICWAQDNRPGWTEATA